MNKKFNIGIWVFCFGLSSVNLSLAAEVIDVPPVIVQPYDMGALNRQTIEMKETGKTRKRQWLSGRLSIRTNIWNRSIVP